jgi:hypothetical protein
MESWSKFGKPKCNVYMKTGEETMSCPRIQSKMGMLVSALLLSAAAAAQTHIYLQRAFATRA